MRLLIILPALFFATAGEAVTTNICFNGFGVYDDNDDDWPGLDNGLREDYYLDDDNKALRGIRAVVVPNGGGTAFFDGYAGDGLNGTTAGCTGAIELGSLPRVVTITLASKAISQTHWIHALNDDTGAVVTITFNATILATPTNNFEWDPTDRREDLVLTALNAATYSVYRHYGGVSNGEIQLLVGKCVDRVTSGTNGFDVNVELTAGDTSCSGTTDNADRKFLVAHEMGHAIFRIATGAFGRNVSTYCDASCPSRSTENCALSQSSHSMRSAEHQSSALQEGFAHFYAVDVWNSHSSEAAVMNYYANVFGTGGASVDAEAETVDRSNADSYPTAFFDGQCTASSAKGSEVDWMRTFWNIHSEQGGSGGVGFNDIMAWLGAADLVSTPEDYDTELTNAASGNLLSLWNTF